MASLTVSELILIFLFWFLWMNLMSFPLLLAQRFLLCKLLLPSTRRWCPAMKSF